MVADTDYYRHEAKLMDRVVPEFSLFLSLFLKTYQIFKQNQLKDCIFVNKKAYNYNPMKPLRFRTKISKSGTIHLPENALLANKEVDVIIMPKKKHFKKSLKAKNFVEKWAGVLHPLENNNSKFDYLMEKYK